VQLAYGVDRVGARAALDLQFSRVSRGGRRRIAEELAVLRAEWGPPVEGRVRFTSRGSAVLSLDGTERRFDAGGTDGVLDRLHAFLTEDVAVRRLRPVVATISGLPGGPTRMTVSPARSGSYEYPDDEPDGVSDGP